MQKRFLIFFLLTIVLVLNGKDIHVDNVKGSDKGDGIKIPFLKINDAVKLAKPGDRIVIANTGKHYLEAWRKGGDQNAFYMSEEVVEQPGIPARA